MTDLVPKNALGSKNVKIVGADHANWRIKDAERSLRFYHDVLGLEVERENERSFVSVRVSPDFTLHLRSDPALDSSYTKCDDHLALVVVGVAPDALRARLEDVGLELERSSEQALGARGEGTALYIRDPDGYLLELKFYGS